MAARVTNRFVVPPGYDPGDYAQLCWNAGSGAVDYNTPVSTQRYSLLPNGCGIHGFGRHPLGQGPFGHAVGIGVRGWAAGPFGHTPFGRGSILVEARHRVTACGTYKFGLAVFDAAGNIHTGSPGEVTVVVHTAPPAPTGLRKTSYNPATHALVLAVDD